MARAGLQVEESLPCPGLGGGAATQRLLDVMSSADEYRTIQVGHDRLQFARTFRPTWALVMGVIFLPVALLGLLFLLVKTTETCVVIVESDHRGTRVRLNGRVRDDVLGALRTALAGGTAAPAPGLGAPVATMAEAPSGLVFAAAAPEVLITSAPSNIVAAPGPVATAPVLLQQTPFSMASPEPPAPPPPPPIPVAPVLAAPPPRPAAPLTAAPDPTPPAASSWDAPPPGAVPVSLPAPELVMVEPVVVESVVVEPVVVEPVTDQREWVLCFDTGRRVAFGGFPVVLIGRDPTWGDGDDAAGLITIDDPERSVSKTHLAIGVGPDGPWVCDRNSTNGSTLVQTDGSETPIPTDGRLPLTSGTYVRFGARAVQVVAMAMEYQS